MEIKVGEYVRTEDGHIGKIIKLSNIEGIFYIQYYIDGIEFKTDIEETPIKKHSPNIIDLIELGDFVNRSEVVGVNDNFYGVKCVYVDTQIYHDQRLTEDEIVSVITHEQMEEMEYKVNE